MLRTAIDARGTTRVRLCGPIASLSQCLFGLCLCLSLPASAQTVKSKAPPPTAAEPKDDAVLTARVAALEAELERQKQEIAAQRAALEQQPAPAEVKNTEQAELAELIANAKQGNDDEPEQQPSLRLYGFADVGLQRMWASKELSELTPETDKLTFVLGNLNLYLDASPSKDFRFLAEVRFGLFPDGSGARPDGGYGVGGVIDTWVSDPSAANTFFTAIKWAGVFPQRAHIDWTPSDLFNLRAGLFLTPYGIWNVDHGTPTRIMVSEPLFLSAQLIPSQLIGVEAYGTVPVLPWTIGYHLHVSNGRTPGQVDFSDSKAIGGRLFASTRNPFPIKIGVSGYMGNSEDVSKTLAMVKTNYAFDERALSGDLSLDIGDLRIRSELVVSWTYYEPGHRRELANIPLADVMRLGTYIVLAYQLPWFGIEPLVMCEFLRVPMPRLIPVGEGMVMPSVGVNVYFTASTMLRTQMSIAHGFDFSQNPVDSRGNLYQAVTRLITAF